MSQLSDLTLYINETEEDLKKLKSGNLPDEDVAEAAFAIYSNMLDMKDWITDFLKSFRKSFKIKHSEALKWKRKAEMEDEDEKEETNEDEEN